MPLRAPSVLLVLLCSACAASPGAAWSVAAVPAAPSAAGRVPTSIAWAVPAPTTLPAPVVSDASGAAPAAVRPVAFRFQVGDELRLDVWQEPDLSSEQRVQPDGRIAPALIAPLSVVGLTLEEVRDRLREDYRQYLKDPQVSVRVLGIYSDRVFVLGEVKTPQAVPLVGPMTLLQAVAVAEGFLEESAEKATVRLLRGGPDGRSQVYCVNTAAILAGMSRDVDLERGDIVYVPTRGVTNWSRTVGQALSPLASAIATAGGAAALYTALDGSSGN